MQKFERWLQVRHVRGLPELVETGLSSLVVTVESVRGAFASAALSSGEVGTLISGIRRFLLLARAMGAQFDDHVPHLRALWRIHKSWMLTVPREFRSPVNFRVALACTVASLLAGHVLLALLCLLQFRCLLRPAAARTCRWCDLVAFSPAECERYPNSFGIVGIGQPTTRRLVVHAPRQHVLPECAGIANFIRRVQATVPTSVRSQPIWTLPPERHLPLFKQVLRRLGIQSLGLAPAGLRGNGATDFWLRTRDIPALRRRGRWSNERTLERYMQERAYFLCTASVPADADARLDTLVKLAPVLLASAPLPPPTTTPTLLQWG